MSEATQAAPATDGELSRTIVETVREPLVVLDGGLRVLTANRSFYQCFGVVPADTEGRRIYDLGNGQWNIPRLRTLLDEVLPLHRAFEGFEVEHDFPAIGRKVMLLNARRLRQADAERILLAIEDVTERRQAEAERQALETRFTSLVKNVRDHAIFTLDPEGRVASWNIAAEHVLGFSEPEVLGRHFGFIFTPEDHARGMPAAELRAAREQGRAEDERWHLRKGGERFWALGIVSALHDADGRLVGFSKILRDMTAAKQAEERLRDSERRHRALFESIDEGVCLIERLPLRADGRRDYRYVAMNPAMQALFGVPDLSGQSVRDNFPDEVEDWYDDYDRVLETGQPMRFERESVPQGMVLEMYLARVEGDSGRLLLVVMQDISARRRAEQALRASERRLSSVLGGMDECFGLLDHGLRILTLNEAALRFDGRPLEAIRGLTHAQAYPAANPDLERLYRRALAEGVHVSLEHRHTRADGQPAWLETRAYPVPEGLAVFWRDITERKRLAEAMYRSLFDSIDQGFCIVEMIFDAQGRAVDFRHLEVNPAFERQSGIKDAAGRTALELMPELEPYWIESFGRVAQTGEAMRYRYRVGATQRWYEGHAWRHGDARQRQVAVLFNDATASVQAEVALRELNETLEARVQQRTRQVRDLARRLTLTELEERRRVSLILHDDLQQLLYGVEMKLGQVESQLAQAAPASLARDLQDVHAWVGRAITTTRRLTVDLSPPILQKEGLADALLWLQRQMRELHGLKVTLQAAHAFYIPDQGLRVLLFQVVRELLFNVTKHSGAKAATVRLQDEDGHLVIHILDAGSGFDADKLGGDGGGGFGLFSVRERLALVGGRMVLRSQPGEGTHVEIHAPVARDDEPSGPGALS